MWAGSHSTHQGPSLVASCLGICPGPWATRQAWAPGSEHLPSSRPRPPAQVVCTLVAAFLHFFFLSSFCWVLTEAWQSYMAVTGHLRNRLIRKRFLCLGWGERPRPGLWPLSHQLLSLPLVSPPLSLPWASTPPSGHQLNERQVQFEFHTVNNFLV